MSNQLNIQSPKFRDFLLSRNLILSETIKKYGNNSWASGIGDIANIGLESNSVKDTPDIVDCGKLFTFSKPGPNLTHLLIYEIQKHSRMYLIHIFGGY